MSERDFGFDRQMIDRLGELPPSEEEIRSTNPWSKPIGFITWGFILTTLHLNLLYLQYILPTIGVILVYLGFRSLRNENRRFRAAWVLSIVKLLFHLGDLVRVTTPIRIVDYPEFTVGTVMLALQIGMFLVFHAALKEVYEKADKATESAPLLWATLWTVAAFLIALSPLSKSWLAFIPMVTFYILMAQSLYRIGGEMDDLGYIPKYAPVRIGNRTFGWAYSLIALATVIACCIRYNHLKLEPREYQPPENTEARQRLLDMALPAEALQYLSDDDVSMISGAVSIEASKELMMFDARESVRATTAYIEMPEHVVYILQYFTWEEGRPIWQDGIQISGETQAKDWQIVDSGLFFRKKGTDYTADFPRLTCGRMTQTGIFGTSSFTQITGALSYPFGSERQGGYVLYRYTLLADSDIYITVALLNYVHLSSPIHIPYANTEDRLLGGAYSFSDVTQQHYTSYDSVALRKRNP